MMQDERQEIDSPFLGFLLRLPATLHEQDSRLLLECWQRYLLLPQCSRSLLEQIAEPDRPFGLVLEAAAMTLES
jgi:hypothetical protein